ncbi:MAG: prephenate dehydrogenase [Actinomycetota bacterium]|nr:prephenate dehydrogenase [Actinomycetota bacterium]
MTTSSPPERIAVVGTGLIGTSVALASARVGCSVRIWDEDPSTLARSASRAGLEAAATFEACVEDADLIVIATPIPTIPGLVLRALAAAPGALVTDVASIKSHIVAEIEATGDPSDLSRWIPGHPMGGSERSGPDHASASVVDGIVWVLTPIEGAATEAIESLESWVALIGARPIRMAPDRHDRLVAFVSHLPQVASTALMGLAATEEADEPEILLLAAGGFRDLTRLASSNPTLWSDILLANREALAEAIDLYVARLVVLRDGVLEGEAELVRSTFAEAKQARLRLAAKPTVRAGVAVLQVVVPDRPGALAELTSVLGTGSVNIEDLQIVHSPEGGRGTVHLTVAATDVDAASRVLAKHDFDPTRLA